MDIMGISTMTTCSTLSKVEQGSLAESVSIEVLSKQLDQIEASGTQMIQMMEQSVNPNLGQSIDVSL